MVGLTILLLNRCYKIHEALERSDRTMRVIERACLEQRIILVTTTQYGLLRQDYL